MPSSHESPITLTLPGIWLLYSSQEGRIVGYRPVLRQQAQAAEARGVRAITHRHHPTTWLNCPALPDPGEQGGANHPETQRVRCARRRREGNQPQDRGRSTHLLLDHQARPIDIRLVPVITIGPAQHRSQVVVRITTHRSTEQDFRVGSSRAEHGVRTGRGIRDPSGIVHNREDTCRISISRPNMTIRSCSPQRLIGSLEGVLCQDGPGRRGGGDRHGW
jgi:hypothetical protein